jgi:hypothetical protein
MDRNTALRILLLPEGDGEPEGLSFDLQSF